MVLLSEVNRLEVILGTGYDRAGEGYGEIQMKKMTFLEFSGAEVTYCLSSTLRCHC